MTAEKSVYQFKLPDVGEGIHEAEIVRWLVKEGDPVTLNQPLLEIQTDKAVVEIPAPLAGQVVEIKSNPGTLARVGDVLVFIAPEQSGSAAPSPAPQSLELEDPPAKPVVGIAGPERRVLAAPAVRKLAAELGVELTEVTGSGPGGRVLPSDVRKHVEQRAKPAEPLELGSEQAVSGIPAVDAPTMVEPLRGLQRRMAERMSTAWRNIPHVTVLEEIDASNLVELRHRLQPEAERRGVRLTYLPLIIKATVQSLKEFPYFNASLDMEAQTITKHQVYHIGIATATANGLLVPVLRHADRHTVLEIAQSLGHLAAQAQNRKLGVNELSGSTFTITNFGSFGSTQATPIINPPEVAILGCGKITEKPVAVQGRLEIRPVLPLALSFDHRVLDGAVAAEFLNRLQLLLTDPNLLLLDLV
jgi:pyruvate dehydrogenase E2 component (dihydrolipoamide acetyltransferase)